MKALALSCALVSVISAGASAQAPQRESLASTSTQPSMNVFRRFAVEPAKMTRFYGDVLALKPLPPIGMPGGRQMIRFQVGTSEIKLQASAAASEYRSGAISEVIGLRVLTFFFPEETKLAERFVQLGYPAPTFHDAAGGRRVAHVRDPENQWVELVVVPGAPAETFDRIEVGVTVSDLEKSRAFYREFIGLEELTPVRDALLATTKYPYRHGTTTINVWTFGKGLPVNTGSAGIQYVVRDVVAVDALAKERGVKIDQPLGNFSASLRTIWLADPDGVTNYFAQIVRNSPDGPASR